MFKTGILPTALLFCVVFSTESFSAENRFALSRDRRVHAPPVKMAESAETLKKLPKAGITINTNSEKTDLTVDNKKYTYIKNNTMRIKEQLGSGFNIIHDNMFILVSDTKSDVTLNKTLATLRICRNALQENYFNAPLKNPVIVFAFRDRQSYRYNLQRIWQEMPISPYGHFDYVRKHIVFNLSTGLGTMIHELTHSLMDPDMPRAPIWIAEGMATLFEECIVDGKNIYGAVNWRLPELARKIDSPEYTPLAKLITLSDREFKHKESMNYAEVRYLCMYFDIRGHLKEIYTSFRNNFHHDKSGRIFIEKAFCKKLSDLEKDWKIWLKTLHYNPKESYSAK